MDRMAREKVRAAEEQLRAKARVDYYSYVRYTNQGTFKYCRFHEVLCGEVQRFIEEPGSASYDILMVLAPPQHGKSFQITETLPSWLLGKNPEASVMEISFSQEFAQRFGRANRSKIVEFGKELFDIEISEDNASVTDFSIKGHRGSMVSKSVTTIVGRPSLYTIVDDPVASQAMADSVVEQDKLFQEWYSSIKSRLAARAKIIVIMTPWSLNDFHNRLLENEKNIRVLRFPCECEDAETDLLGRAAGDPLSPELGKDAAWLAETKASFQSQYGARSWAALYQGRPTLAEGNMFKREDFNFVHEIPKFPVTVVSVDAAFKAEKQNDKVAITLWGKHNARFYLLAVDNRRMDFAETIRATMAMRDKCKGITGRNPDCTLIEDKANGSAIISVLRERVEGIIPITPKESKEARAQSVLPLFEAGQIMVWTNCVGANELIEQAAAFPGSQFDDLVDSMTQALNRMRNMDANTGEATAQEDFFGPFGIKEDKWGPLGGEPTKEYLFYGF
jgi:predicted phage terminase large subunit-like protein